MALSADQIAAALAAAGHSEEEIQSSTSLYAEAKYEPETVALKPTFFVLSDATVKIGKDDHILRFVNPHDLRLLLPVVFNLVMHLMRENHIAGDIEQLLTKAGPRGTFDMLASAMRELGRHQEYPKPWVALLEQIASIASTDSRTLSAGDLIALPGEQLPDLLEKLWEVNKQDFLGVLRRVTGMVPAPYRAVIASRIFSPALAVLKALKNVGETSPSQLETPSSGGADSTGNSSSSSPSAPTPASAKKTSKAAALAASSS